ncbi:MAG TPA: FAD-dependent oxidoreductase [Pirellulaceae bacterium]|nr:FAD-dependent oxidoreductase [Pirellulaceae bacterium]HMO91511.1 FAD-dependent oxidoreductase [Pirellulaceae bacterium]HMP70984.1 FAD-dependent oxidoreductase [Pirellulaceae bacterium]
MNYDCVIIGGGAIGLSIAYEMARRGATIAVIERSRLGRESSWAGAGVIPPAPTIDNVDPFDQLKALSHALFPDWSEALLNESGIDNGFWKCGAVYVGRSDGEVGAIEGLKYQWADEGIKFDVLDNDQLLQMIPAIAGEIAAVRSAIYLPDEYQICNPYHIKALIGACRLRNVDFFEEADIQEFHTQNLILKGLETTAGPFYADHFVAASGAWTGSLLKQLDIQISMVPVRGQMLAFKLKEQILFTVINDSSRYLVPRKDGWILAGSTMEHAGFDKSLTPEAQKSLFDFANRLIPQLNATNLLNRWAGLRPGTFDGFPYLGRCPTIENLFVATGHFRWGLTCSTGTANIIADLVEGKPSAIDLTHFRVSRG